MIFFNHSFIRFSCSETLTFFNFHFDKYFAKLLKTLISRREKNSQITNFSSSFDFFSLIYFFTLKRSQALLSGFNKRKLFSEFINRIADFDKKFWKIVKRKFHKFINSQMKSLAIMKKNAKRKRKKTKKKKKIENWKKCRKWKKWQKKYRNFRFVDETDV